MHKASFLFALLLPLTVWVSPNGHCAKPKNVELYPDDRPARDYGARLDSIEAGDTLRLDKGQRFKILDVLGEGDTTRIFDIGDGWALRVPKKATRWWKRNSSSSHDEPALQHFSFFIETRDALENDGIPVVELDQKRTRYNFAVVKKVEVLFDLKTYMEMRKQMEKSERKAIDKALIAFARTTYKYNYISDFKTRNLIYTGGRRWLLIDIGNDVHSIRIGNRLWRADRNIFSTVERKDEDLGGTRVTRYVTEKLERKISEAIQEEREKHACGNGLKRSKQPSYHADDEDD